MKNNDFYTELNSIKNLMERSTKFLSLSGISGVAAGLYALICTFFFFRINDSLSIDFEAFNNQNSFINFTPFAIVAFIVLILAISTCLLLTIRQAKKRNDAIWNPVSKKLLTDISIPLIVGGIFIVIQIFSKNMVFVIPSCLIFYGIGLISVGNYTFNDLKWLGICQITVGLITAAYPQLGIITWAIGFGLLNIIYGLITHFKYKQ